MANLIIDYILRFLWPITVAGLVLAVLLACTVTRLRPEYEISENLPYDAKSSVALRMVDEHFGGILPVFVCVDWPERVDVGAPKLREALVRVHDICEQHEAVNHPFSMLNVLRAVPGLNPRQFPYESIKSVVRTDLRRAVVVSRSQDRGNAYLSGAFAELRDQLQQLESEFDGFRFHLTGSSMIATRNIRKMITDLATSLGLATAVIFLTMAVAYRSLRIGLICLLPNALPLLITAAALAWVDGSLRFAGVIVFSVCLGIAVDDTIHLVSRFQRELRSCGNVDEALRRSVLRVGSALVTTTIVLLVGLAIPSTSEVAGNRMFAWLSCTAIGSALIGDLILLPAMLACFVRNQNGSVE